MTSARRFVLPPNFLDDVRDRLDGADFVYRRESLTLATLRGQKITRPDVAFGPDGTFAFDHTDIGAATRLLDSPDLESKDPANTLRVMRRWDATKTSSAEHSPPCPCVGCDDSRGGSDGDGSVAGRGRHDRHVGSR